jgi:hypothetical protein
MGTDMFQHPLIRTLCSDFHRTMMMMTFFFSNSRYNTDNRSFVTQKVARQEDRPLANIALKGPNSVGYFGPIALLAA